MLTSARVSRAHARAVGRAGEHRLQAQIACTVRTRSLSELTWPEDGEADDARDEEGEDAMTEAKDEADDVEDASSSACGVTSEGRKTNYNLHIGIRFTFNTLQMMVEEELTFRFFFSNLMAAVLGTILPKEKRELQGFDSLSAMHA